MSITVIHVSKKLEKQVKKFIGSDETRHPSPLGKWNALLFYESRKKCWLLTNKLTQYHLFLPDITAAKLPHIEQIIKDTFYEQLVYDGIIHTTKSINDLMGTVALRPTDNDRSMTGFQNHRLYELQFHTIEYAALEHVPIRDLNHRINTTPIELDKSKRRAYTNSIDEMARLLNDLT